MHEYGCTGPYDCITMSKKRSASATAWVHACAAWCPENLRKEVAKTVTYGPINRWMSKAAANKIKLHMLSVLQADACSRPEKFIFRNGEWHAVRYIRDQIPLMRAKLTILLRPIFNRDVSRMISRHVFA